MGNRTSPDIKARLEHALARLSNEPRVTERRERERRSLRGFAPIPVNHERRFLPERRNIERRLS